MPINKQGFTLLELLVSVFIFSLVMITVVALFTRFVTFQKRSQSIQQNMEDARYVMELMAKTLRTSSVVSSTASSINLYDYSQDKCIIYRFNAGAKEIEGGSRSPGTTGDKDSCNFGLIAPTSMVNNSINSMALSVTQSVPGVVGKVTISTVICSSSGCSGAENDRASLQTTVSLRDYTESSP